VSGIGKWKERGGVEGREEEGDEREIEEWELE